MRPLAPQLGFAENFSSYASLFVRSLKASFAYRASTVTSVISSTLVYAIPMMVWWRVFQQNPSGMVVSKAQMFPYLLLAACVNYGLSMSVEFRIGQRIRQGLIATDLLKPVDFQISQGIQALSDGLFNGALGMLVFGCGYMALGKEVLPTSGSSFALFWVSFLLAFLIQYFVCFVFVQGAFYTYSGYGIFAARGALHQTFSGLSAPLALYPPFLKAAGEWLPFRHTVHTPVAIYMGWVKGWDAVDLVLQQVLWALGLYLLGKLLMIQALKQLEVQGG